MRALPLFFLIGCSSCGAHDVEVRWPASPDIDLVTELIATARAAGAPSPLLPGGERADSVPELPPDAPGVKVQSFVFDGLWVGEVVLGEVAPDTPLPLVVMLHGRGDRPRVPGGPFGRVPTPMRVIVPRGPLSLGSGYAWARHSVTQNRHRELAEDLVRMATRLEQLIRHVTRTRPTVGTPIVTGFSQGGLLAWTAGLRHPETIGMVIPIAGWVPPDARPRPYRPTRGPIQRSIHGTEDPTVTLAPTRELVRELRTAGYSVELVEEEGVGHTVSPEMNRLFESWLEEALSQRAPGLRGGLGVAGVDETPMEDFETGPVVEDEEATPAPLPEHTESADEHVADPSDSATGQGEE